MSFRNSFRSIFVWLVALSTIWFLFVCYLVKVKSNYTELHRRVTDLEIKAGIK